MKAILQAYSPKELERIARGEQIIKVCKTAPKDTPFKVYMYCTNDKNLQLVLGEDNCYRLYDLRHYKKIYDRKVNFVPNGNGKVVGEYVCKKVEKYRFSRYEAEYDITHDQMAQMFLNQPELIAYGKGKTLRGLHIFAVKIYDEPKELYNFHRVCNKKCSPSCDWYIEHDYAECGCGCKPNITRPPQSWCYVEEVDYDR